MVGGTDNTSLSGISGAALKLLFTGIVGAALFAIGLSQLSSKQTLNEKDPPLLRSLLVFCYSCFLKPHSTGGKGTQQDALESFYSSQAGIYDATRKTLLKGREDMLALVAAQLLLKAKRDEGNKGKRVWVDASLQSGQRQDPRLTSS